jgi:hypothetical protein
VISGRYLDPIDKSRSLGNREQTLLTNVASDGPLRSPVYSKAMAVRTYQRISLTLPPIEATCARASTHDPRATTSMASGWAERA